MAALPSEDFIPAPIASENADFIPAPIAQDDEDFIPSTLTPEQTVVEALAGVEGYSAAVQTAAEYGDNPTLRPLFVKALADRQKKQASKSTEDSLNDAAKIALALPGIAGRTLYSVVTESIPAVANNVKSLFAGNPAEQLQAVGEAGSAISGAAVSTLELLRKGYENVSDSVTFSKPSLSRGLEIARNPLLIAQPSKAILQSDEEYERRADADLLGAKTIKEAASGGLLPSGIREKAAALGSPIRPEVSEKLQVAYDPLNWVPFGAGFVVGKVGNALGLGVRTAGGVEVVAKGLQKLADVEKAAETVGVLRRGVGATVSGAGQKAVRASDSPAVVGTIAGATALAGGAEPITAMLASLIGAGTVRGAGPVADVLKSSGRTLVRVGDQIAGKASLGPMGRFAESAVNFVKPSIVEGSQSGLALGLPFALSARDEQDVAEVLGSSAAFGVGGHLVGQVVGAGNRYFSIDSAFRDSTAKVPDSAYERPEFSYYSQDQGNVVEAKSREVFDTLSNKGAQTVEALKKLFVKPDANGIKTEIYILDRATSDALAKQYAGSEQGRAGFSVEIPDQKRRLVVINADSNGGISLGHEIGHAFYASLPYAQKKALLDTVSKTIRPDDFAQLKTRYEELFNQKRNEDGSYTPVPEAERVKISDDYAAQEYLAESFSAYLNGVPIEKFGTPRGLADRIRVSIGAVLEKGGARRLTTDNSAAVRTELGYKPSAALAELYQNFIEARKLDNTTLTTINGEAAPVDIILPPVEGPTDRATNAPAPANAPVSPLANIREVEAKPVVPGFKKGDPIGDIRDKTGMLIAEEAKVLRKNEDGTYEIEFIDPDTGKRLIATTDEASLVSPISPGKVDPNKTVFPASPVTPQTPFFAATAPIPPTVTPPTAATTVAPKQVENVARPQGSVATPNLRPGAASAFVKKAPDTLHSQNRKVLEDLMLAPRAEIPAVETDYYAAASPVQSPDAIVRAAQRKAADALEKSGEPNPFRATFNKLFVPYRWSSYKLDAATNARLYGEGTPRQPGGIYGMSVDKVGQNLDLLRGLAKENLAVAETLSAFGVSQDYLASDALVSDFRTYLDNQAHGYGGDGKKLSLPADTRPGTITAQDPNFVPTALPANKRQLFNLLLNLEQQATRTPGMEFSARFAKQNGIDPLTVGFDDKGRPLTDNNALRAALLRNGFDPRLLNSAVENLPTENFTSAIKVRPDVALPAADVAITQAGFMPETGSPRRPQGNDETRSVAAQYTQKAGIQAAPHDTYAPVNETTLRRVADFYENAKNEPEKPEVQKAYQALAEETRAQYEDMVANGIKIEPYEGKGEPYANSAAMLADVRDNKHLYFFLTKNAFGEGADVGNNALLKKSGIKINGIDLLYNDLFRAVHDYFGHTAEGFEFGPRGEYNAYLAHSRMFSDEAKPALAAETLAQNAWVNFGPQLRRADGSLPKAGDADFVPIAKRRFADQKNTVVPPELLQAADPQAAFMPEDSQLEGFGESMREKMRAKMAKVEPSDYEEGDRLELPSGKIVEFVSDLLPKKGGARDGAQMAYVRFEDGMESSVYLDDLTKTYGPGGSFMPETQFDAPKKLPDAIQNKTLKLVHRGAAGVSELDPAKFGSSRITPRSELAGEPRVFFYVKGFENKGDPSQLRGNKYEIPVSGKRIYDADTDALDWTQDVNRQRADIMLKDAGYVGLIRTRGKGKNLFKQVEIFEKVSVDGTPVSETEVRTPRSRLETPEGRKVDAQLLKKYGSTGAYFDRLERYEETGKISFMPEALEMGRNEEFTKIPSDPEVVLALSSDKKDYVGAHRKLAAGTPVGLRIDIPAFTRTGKYVVTVHEKAGSSVGKRIGYDGIATVDEPTFFSNETGAQKIYDGGAKFPVATVEGLFNPSREIPSDISDWTPVGYDPKEHSFFYDKNSGEPVLSGDQAVSVGNTVFVKNPVYGDVADFRFMPETLDPAKVDALPGEELARGIDIDPTPVNELNDGDAKIDWTAAFMPETIPGVFPLIDQKLLEQIKSETPTIAAMHIDRMRVGSYKGIDLQGGMFYPAIKENVDKGVLWAFNSKGAASRSANRAAQNGGYVKLVLMAEGNIVGNRTFTNVWFNDVREAVASGDLKEKRALVELNRVRRSFASETDHRTKWETLEQAQKDIVDMPQMLRGSTYFQKTKVVTKADGEKVQYGSLLTKALTSVGFPDAGQLVSALEEPAFKGVPQGAAVAVLKFDPIKDKSEIKTAQEVGVPEHASYKYVLKGRPVARLENYSVVDADYPEIRRLIMSQQKKDFPVGRALIPETPAGTINYGLQDATIAPRQAAEALLAREGVVSLPQRGLADATVLPRNK